MATKKTKQTKPTYNQLMRERKKDHEDIIAKAARITGLETDLKHSKGTHIGLLCALEEKDSLIKALDNHITKVHKDRDELQGKLLDYKITLKTILSGEHQNLYNRNLLLDIEREDLINKKSKAPCLTTNQ